MISLVAPAGYGKTTLLAQWAESWEPRVASTSAHRRYNDPAVLLGHVVAALERVESFPSPLPRALASSSPAITVVPVLVSAVRSLGQSIALVLDDAEAIAGTASIDTITELALAFPAGSRFAIASRVTTSLPAARFGAQGGLLELGADDLAMSEGEAAAVIMGAGWRPRSTVVEALARRTEGWAAGLYLAALAMPAGSPRAVAGFAIAGDDRFVGDYLRSELLDRASDAEVSFLCRTSVLDRLCGGLCDAVLGGAGIRSDARGAGEHYLLIVPLDRRRVWYRYHHLFQELLRAE